VTDGGTGDWVLHVDLDQFLAAVEILRRPELKGKPVVVGGDGDPTRPRQVVATASYEARAFGVRSGMPLRTALRKCPDAVFLPSDKPAYEEASERVMAALRTLPVTVEVWGWDEAFLGAQTDDPEALARIVIATVLAETSLSCAVGIGQTRLQAKTATGFAKEGGPTKRSGIAKVTWLTWIATMGARPVSELWGIGNKTAEKLAEAGITSVLELATADEADLARRFGPSIGPYLKVLGMGGHVAPIDDTPWVPRSRSREVTFTRDVTDPGEMADHVDRLAREITESVVAEGRRVTHVSIKLRTKTFFTRTKIRKLPTPSTNPDDIAAATREVLGRFELDRPVRLLGVRLVLEMPEPPRGHPNDRTGE
jgi:DNA polymerase-4